MDVIFFILVSIFIACGSYFYYFHLVSKSLPPGPWGLPVFGYLPFIDPLKPHQTIANLVRKYGKVMSLQMGQIPCIVLADPNIIRNVLSKYESTGRAPLFMTHGIMNGFGLICAQGERWRIQRKFTLDFMRKFGLSRHNKSTKMEEKILCCIDEFLSSIEPFVKLDSHFLDVKLSHTVGNMMNEVLFGIHYPENDEKWRRIQKLRADGIKEIQVNQPVNFLPWLRFLVPRFQTTLKWILKGKHETHKEYQKVIKESSRQNEDCIVGFFFKEKEQMEKLHSPDIEFYTDEQLNHLVADLFGAGVDTSLTTLKWALVYLASLPEAQDVIRKEFKSKPKFSMFASEVEMPQTSAILLEIQRLCPVVPMGVPHGTIEPMIIDNKWKIPKGTMIIISHWSLNYDPDQFQNPNEFLPLRFLAENGSLRKHQSIMPFQVGRRRCVGEDFGKAMVTAFIIKLLSIYHLELASPYDFKKEPPRGFTRSPNDFKLILKRVPEYNKI